MSSYELSFSRDGNSKLFLPTDPFPYPFEEEGLKPILKDLLKVLRRHPAYVEPTHAAFWRLNVREGINSRRSEALLRSTGKEIPSYNITNGRFFGVEEPVFEIVNGYGAQAKAGGRTRRKALVITGSPGAGKSDLVNHIQYNVMHGREPIPYLAGSPMWSNPLNALFLVKLVASKKHKRRPAAVIKEITAIIDSLDLTGESELNYKNSDLQAVVEKHGFAAGEVLTSEDLAQICMKSEKDFVATVCYGLDLDRPTVDALVQPDPWATEVALGEFFGNAMVNADILEAAGSKAMDRKGKRRGQDKYGHYDSEWATPIAELPIDNMFMSEGQGMVDVSEVQPINFDLSVWRGGKDIGAIGLYDDRDPRTVSPSGVFNKGKLIILTEGLRNPDEAFRILLEGLEGQRLSLDEPLGNYYQQGVGWEGMIIIHSNDEQWNKFYSNPAHRAHLDRFFWVSFKYPVEASQAALVTEKLWKASQYARPQDQGGVHREPLVKEYLGLFRAATHIHWESKGNLPFMAVLNAYNGKNVRQSGMGTEIDVHSLREKAPFSEGLDGIGPREMDTLLGELAAQAAFELSAGIRTAACFTVAELRDHIKDKLRKDPRLDDKTKQTYISWLEGPLEREFRRIELSKVYKAAFIPNFGDLCQQYFRKYLEYLKALNRPGTSRASFSGSYQTTQQMESFLQEIERSDTMAVNSGQADKFRANVLVALRVYAEEHGTSEPAYSVYEPLRRCIEAYVLRQAKDITGVIGLSNLTEEEKKRLGDAKSRLIGEHKYCQHCSQRLLVEVATTRDFLVA